jgi:hypothetical protein
VHYPYDARKEKEIKREQKQLEAIPDDPVENT